MSCLCLCQEYGNINVPQAKQAYDICLHAGKLKVQLQQLSLCILDVQKLYWCAGASVRTFSMFSTMMFLTSATPPRTLLIAFAKYRMRSCSTPLNSVLYSYATAYCAASGP